MLKKWLFAVDLKHERGKVTEYSDLGFMLLGFVVEQIYARPLDQLFYEEVIIPLGLNRTGFISLPHRKGQKNFDLHFAPGDFVATELCPWRNKILQGEVHDDNTWAAGGVMGHAGLFSTAQESLQMLESLALELKNDADFSFPASSTRSLHNIFSQGFMVYPGLRAQAGNDFAAAVGHTGFVGTSAWFQQERNLSVVLLTNRVHPSRSDTRWIQTRLNFHQSLWTELA
jgi:CubicO group peptidase (beta-lactamase class C family)